MSGLEEITLPDSVPEPPEDHPSNIGPSAALADHAGRAIDTQGMPCSLEAERTILGAIFLDNNAFTEASEIISADDFMLTAHQRVFRLMGTMIAEGGVVDIVTLANALARRKEIESVGGVAWLASLTEGLPRRLAVREYANIVAETAVARRAIELCTRAISEAASRDQRGPEVVSRLAQNLAEMAANSRVAWRGYRQRDFLVGARTFMGSNRGAVDWAVQGLIQRGANGLIVGDPGTSKSLLALHLLLHLVAGRAWMGRSVPKAMKCALVSREDHPGLTQQRLPKLVNGLDVEVAEALDEREWDEWLYFNSRAQTETFALDKEGDICEVIDAFRERGVELAVFDVFRRLWSGDENDNEEVAKVLASLTRIQTECGCSVVLIHHVNKSENGTIFQRIRGASAIYGWREFGFGLSIANPEEEEPRNLIRKVAFETKADSPAPPLYYQIEGFADKTCLTRCDPPEPLYRKKKEKKAADAGVRDGKASSAADGGLF